MFPQIPRAELSRQGIDLVVLDGTKGSMHLYLSCHQRRSRYRNRVNSFFYLQRVDLMMI